MKKGFLIILLVVMVCLPLLAFGEEYSAEPVMMKVINCKEWVSLREKPDTKSDRLAEVPLNALVVDCEAVSDKFVRCTYNGTTGYILSEYLQELRVCLNWQQDACHVIATRSGDERDETLIVTCMVGDNEPVWTYTTKASGAGQYNRTAAFMGGTDRNPQVMVLNSDVGLTMLELWDGSEKWTLGKDVIDLGSGNCYARDDASGVMYIAGTEGPDPVAISVDGRVLWRSDVGNDEVFWPYSIEVRMDDIEVRYESGSIHEGYSYFSVVLNMAGEVEMIDLIP